MTLKDRIKELAAQDMTQAEIAEALGVSRQVVSYHLSGYAARRPKATSSDVARRRAREGMRKLRMRRRVAEALA